MPSLVSASVGTMLASASITAGCSKKASGWQRHTFSRAPVDRLLEGEHRVGVKAPAEVPGGGGVGEALGPQAVEEHRGAATHRSRWPGLRRR